MEQTIYVVIRNGSPIAAFIERRAAEGYVAQFAGPQTLDIIEVTLYGGGK